MVPQSCRHAVLERRYTTTSTATDAGGWRCSNCGETIGYDSGEVEAWPLRTTPADPRLRVVEKVPDTPWRREQRARRPWR